MVPYVQHWAKYADRWVLESRVAADGLAKKLRISGVRFHVVPNSCSFHYYEARETKMELHPALINRQNDCLLLVFTAYYPHKNLEIIPYVALKLKEKDPSRRYCFVLTFSNRMDKWREIAQEAERLGVSEYIINIGNQPVSSGPSLYYSCNALFLPTLLETFTASYPEAMSMQRPIITSNLDFARDICQDAAIYFEPMNAEEAAEAIIKVAHDDNWGKRLVEAEDRRLKDFGTAKERFEMYMDLIEKTANLC